jgi:hypothetical protein
MLPPAAASVQQSAARLYDTIFFSICKRKFATTYGIKDMAGFGGIVKVLSK